MKKKGIVLAIIIAIASLGLTACNFGDIIEWGGSSFGGGDVCYYGCPNSKRVRRLNLKKNNKGV